jgi:hypothetical protein
MAVTKQNSDTPGHHHHHYCHHRRRRRFLQRQNKKQSMFVVVTLYLCFVILLGFVLLVANQRYYSRMLSGRGRTPTDDLTILSSGHHNNNPALQQVLDRIAMAHTNNKEQEEEQQEQHVGNKKNNRYDMYQMPSGREGLQRKPFDFTARDFSDKPVLHTIHHTRQIPDMTTDKGGVILFLHCPKTGGQTIRHNFGSKKMRQKIQQQLILLHQNKTKEEEKEREQATTSTSIRTTIPDELAKRIRFVWCNYKQVFHVEAIPKINRHLSGLPNRGKILLVEIHGMDSLTAIELEPYLHAWRERAAEAQVPFFTFTLVRQPIDTQVSFFNYYYLHPGDERFCHNGLVTSTRCYREEEEGANNTKKKESKDDDRVFQEGTKFCSNGKIISTETDCSNANHEKKKKKKKHKKHHDPDQIWEEFLQQQQRQEKAISRMLSLNEGVDLEDAMVQLAYDNPQCLFLARGERTFGVKDKGARNGLTRQECQAAYSSLERSMDWIGRTETLSQETLPLLTTIMFQDPTLGQQLPRTNVSPQSRNSSSMGFLHVSAIQSSTRQALENKSQLDQYEIYQRAVQDYTLDQFVKYKTRFPQ